MASCALARQRLIEAVQYLRKASTREKVTTGIKAGFVGSVVTPMRALAGNASWGTFLQLARNPLVAAIDLAESTAKSARTGFQVKPHEYREYVNTLNRDGMGVLARGFRKGGTPIRDAGTVARASKSPVVTFVSELRTRLAASQKAGDFDVRVGNSSVEYKPTSYDSPIAQTLTDGAFAILEAADRPFWQAAFDTGLYRQSLLYGVRQGLKGADLKAASAKAMAQPTAEMVMRATDEANYATFKDRNPLSEIAGNIKRSIKTSADRKIDPNLEPWERRKMESAKAGAQVADYVAENVMPFTGVPSSVAGKMVSVSPLGILSRDIRKGAQYERAMALANAGIGTGMMVLGMELYEQGLLTGAPPTNPTEKEQWKAAGKQPFSIKVAGKWLGLKSLGPVASSLYIGAAMRRGTDEGQTSGEALGQGLSESAKFLTQQTYLTNIGNLIEAAAGGERAAGKLGRIVGGLALPVPALVGQINRAADPYVRDNRAFKDQLQSKLPLGHLYAPTPRMVGPLGPLPRKSTAERLSSVVSPLPITEDRDTEVLKEIRRLSVSFGVPDKTLEKTVDGKKFKTKIPRDQWAEFTRQAGTGALQLIAERMAEPSFKDLDDYDKKKELDKLVTKERDKYRKLLKTALADSMKIVPKKIRR